MHKRIIFIAPVARQLLGRAVTLHIPLFPAALTYPLHRYPLSKERVNFM